MWTRVKNAGPTAHRQSFSLVHQYIQHFNEVSGNKTAVVRRRSKTPGVMIMQYIINIPEGKSTPDFQCKPNPVTTTEGKSAIFTAVVTGDPKPEVSWKRARGNMSDKFHKRHDESTGEYILEIHNVSAADIDTYKCYAVNEYGKAIGTATLNVIEASSNPDFRNLLKKSKVERADGEMDERFWDVLLNADRKDHERVCTEFGVADLQLILKKLEAKKEERMQNKFKEKGAIPHEDAKEEQSLQCVRRTKDFSAMDTGLNQVDVKQINYHLTEFKFSDVDFVIKIQEIKAQEREDALFECVLTHPLRRITWLRKGNILEDGDKYSICVSEHKLIHKLLIRDCKQLDKGIYSAVAGMKSCSAWLVVEAEGGPTSAGKRKPRKTTVAAGVRADLEKVAKEQQLKNQKEMEKILAAVKARHEAGQLEGERTLTSSKRDGETTAVTGPGKNLEAVGNNLDTAKTSVPTEPVGSKEKTTITNSKGDGTVSTLDVSGCVTKTAVQVTVDDPMKKKYAMSSQADFDKVADANEGEYSEKNEDFSRYKRHGQETKHRITEFSDKCIHIDQIQMFTTSQNEVTLSGEKDSEAVRHSEHAIKAQRTHHTTDLKEPGSDSETNEDSAGQVKHPTCSKQKQKPEEANSGESTCPKSHCECDKTEDATGSATHTRRKRQGPVIEDLVTDPGVQFICGLSDVNAMIEETAELTCKLSSENCEGVWFRDGKKILPDDNFTITKDGAIHKLVIIKCKEEHSGKYRFEADDRKTEAIINVQDPPRFDPEDLSSFTEPVTVKAGQSAIFKMHFLGHEPIKSQWYREGEELQDDNNTKIETSAGQSLLLLTRCQRKNTGLIKIKLKNKHGYTEAISHLIVLDKPTSPLGPAEVTESSATCIEFRWRPPKDDGGSPVIKYIMERQQVGQNAWRKVGEIPGVPSYRDTGVDHGRKYLYRIQAMTAEGTSEVMETDEIQAGTLAFPGPPAPPKVVSAYDNCINLSWASPGNTGGSRILGYILEKRKKGSNLWTVVNAMDELIKETKYVVKDVVAGMEYEFRVTAINLSGAGEFSNPSEFVFARDPKKPPGKVRGMKVTETSYTHFVLTWSKPEEKPEIQDEAKGYFVEIRQADCVEWSCCNSTAIITTSFTVKGLKSMDMYWVRVIAANDGGKGPPEELANYVLAMPSPVRPKITSPKMKSFMVVRAGNTVRITINFEASPWPDIIWLKDNVPVTKRVTISNSDSSSQLLIPSSERLDSGIYSILVKNLAGQETFSTEVRVTDYPKPPGLVELVENVPGTVTVMWEPSPDEKWDDRLHYTVSKVDSTKCTRTTVADRLFNNKFIVCNIMHGREYHFRVYAKNDMGISAPSESPTWGIKKNKERFMVSIPTRQDCDLRCAPTFIVPLKLHTAPKGYECCMSCAVKGNPKPRITWHRNHISLNTSTNYYISNTCGVCSMLILHVGPKDTGEYTITAENALGQAECSTVLSITE